MDIAAGFNFFEAILWFSLAAFILIFGVLRGKIVVGQRKTFLFLSAVLLLFGISDLIEMKTGAWWSPIWLLLYKGVCIIGIIIGFGFLYKNRSKRK